MRRGLLIRSLRAIAGVRLDNSKRASWRLKMCGRIAYFLLKKVGVETYDVLKDREERFDLADQELETCATKAEAAVGRAIDDFDMIADYADAARRCADDGDVMNEWDELRKVCKEAHVHMESIRAKVREEMEAEPSKHDLYCCCGDIERNELEATERDRCLADICVGCKAGDKYEGGWHDTGQSMFACSAMMIRNRWGIA